MTAFDPKLAREILMRRHRRLENAGVQEGGRVYSWIWSGGNPHDQVVRDHEDKRDALYKQADQTRDVISYLDDRIWDEMKPAERAWEIMKDWDYAPFGPKMVGDVLIAHHIASAGNAMLRELDIPLSASYDDDITNEGEGK